MKKKVEFNLAAFGEKLENKSCEKLCASRLFDNMIDELMTVGISALNFDLLTTDNVEQYRRENTSDHNNEQLLRRFSLLPAEKLIEVNNILF